MDVFDSRFFKINKIFLSVLGQWVYQESAMKILSRFIAFLLLTSNLIPQIYFLFDSWGNADAIFECFPPFLFVVLSICQIVNLTLQQNKFSILVKYIENDWNVWSSEIERKILEEHAEKGRFYTLLYAANFYFTITTFIGMSMAPIVLDNLFPLNETRQRQLVFAAKYPFDENEYFIWLLIHGAIVCCYNASIVWSCESILAATTQHVCGRFKTVSYKLKSAMNLSINDNNFKGRNDESYKQLVTAIKLHNEALEFSTILDSLFSPSLLFTMGINVIAISTLLIQTLNSFGSFFLTIKYGMFAGASFFHLYLLTLPAQTLLDTSLEVSEEACAGEWYDLPIEAQKIIIPIILRSQLPSTLTVGKFCTMDMVSFSAFFKTSLSYFTVFSTMR